MNRDPLGIGPALYGFRPQPAGVGTLLAAGPHFMTLIPDGHGGCGISTFCKNPLHPGPCKGWKKHLGKHAPGALHAIEKAHKEKLAIKRAKTAEAKSAASKGLTNRQLESPLHSKKATIKAANTILGDDEAKASKKADRVILNKTEIKKYSKIKAAQVNSIRTKNGLEEDPGLEDRIADALAADNLTGKDTKYRETIAVAGDSMGAQLAQKHCAKGDGDCDGKPYEWLREESAGYAEQALLTGDDSDLDTFLKDYDAGKAKPPAEPKPKPAPEPAAPEPPAAAPKKKAIKKAPEPKTGDAAKAEKGKDFGLGLLAFAKGNKTIGTKATQKDFADKLEKAIGNDDEAGVIKAGAEVIASSLVTHAQKSKGVFGPSVTLGKNEEAKFKELLQPELEDGLKGGDAPKPVLESIKKAITAAKESDFDGVKEAKAELNDHIKKSAAAKLGLDPNASANVVAAHILFDPDKNLADGKAKARMQVLEGLTKEEFDGLPPKVQATAENWMNSGAEHYEEEGGDFGNGKVDEIVAIQEKLGLSPYQKNLPAGPDLSIFDGDAVSDMTKTDALHQLDAAAFDALPDATKTKIANFLNGEEQAYFVGSDSHQDVMGLKAKFGLPATPASWQKITVTPMTEPDDVPSASLPNTPSVLDNLLNGTYQPEPKDVFGPDGNPDHELAVATTLIMTQADWDGLSDADKSNAMDHISDALSNGEPGAHGAMSKLVGYFEGDKAKAAPPTQPPAAAPPMSAKTKTAVDFATGAKSGTMTKKFEAYQQLEEDAFAALPPDVQQLILADLKAAKAKFVNPAKKQMVQANLDVLTPLAGGGAGAGGPVDTTNPATKSAADKIHDGSDWASKFVPLLDKPGDKKSGSKDEIYAATLGLLEGANQNGTTDTVAQTMADIWADSALQKLNSMHEDPIMGEGPMDPDAVAAIKPALSADIAKKFKGEPGPTPALDAWTKAVHSGAMDDADDFVNVAHPDGAGASSEYGAKPDPAAVKTKQAQVGTLWTVAGDGVKPLGAGSDDQINADVQLAMNTNTVDAWANDEGQKMAAGVFGTVSVAAGVPPLPGDPADFGKLMDAVTAEFVQALKSNKSSLPSGSITEQLHQIGTDVAEAGDNLAMKQGWPDDSDALKNFKKALMTSKLQELAAKVAPKPAPSPVTPPTPSPSAPSAPSATNTAVGTGVDISHIPEAKQLEMWNDLKALPSGKFLSDPKEDVYANLLALAAAHGSADEPMSVLQVLKSLDAGGSKANGWTNINKWENEFVAWLKTPAGTAFAKANPTANPKTVQKITGDYGPYEGITTDLAELSKKVKLLPGPGDFDDSKPSSDFNFTSVAKADTWRKTMLADQGGNYTSSQLSGIKTYTGSSFIPMNEWLRGETNTISSHLKSQITKTQDAMRPLPQDTLLIRGTGWDALPEGFQSAKGVQQLIGKTIMDEAFMSTSVGTTPGYGSGKPLWLEIEAPKGTQAAFVEGVSSNNGEREMLLAAGQQYRILGVEQKGGRTHVRVRIVTP